MINGRRFLPGSIRLRPNLGIGNDRPYDWNIEAGLRVVGS